MSSCGLLKLYDVSNQQFISRGSKSILKFIKKKKQLSLSTKGHKVTRKIAANAFSSFI